MTSRDRKNGSSVEYRNRDAALRRQPGVRGPGQLRRVEPDELPRPERPVRLADPRGRAREVEQVGERPDHLLQDAAGVAAPRERLRHAQQRARDLRRLSFLVEQPRVLERHGRRRRERLEQAEVVGVELVQPELRQHDRADHPVVEPHRDGQDRLVDLGRSLDLLRELAVVRVRGVDGLAGLGDPPGDALAHGGDQQLLGLALVLGERAHERHRVQRPARGVEQVDPAVVELHELAEVLEDRLRDVADVLEAVQLARDALQQLEVADHLGLALGNGPHTAPLPRLVDGDVAAAGGLCLEHRIVGARHQLAGLPPVRRALRHADRHGDAARRGAALGDACPHRLGHLGRLGGLRGGHHDRELVPADTADRVPRPGGLPAQRGDGGQHTVAREVAVFLVHTLEPVDVDQRQRDRHPGQVRPAELVGQAFLEMPVVVQPGQAVDDALGLQPFTDARALQRDRGQVGQPPGHLQLVVVERPAVAGQVEHAAQLLAGHERHAHQGPPGDAVGAGVRREIVDPPGFPPDGHLAGDALAEPHDLPVDVLRVGVDDLDGPQDHEVPVGLVQHQRVVRNERRCRPGDEVERPCQVGLRQQRAHGVGERAERVPVFGG